MGLRSIGQCVQIASLAAAVIAVSGLIAAAPAGAVPNGPSARYVDTMTVPDNFVPTPFRFGGLSGIDNVGGGNYVAVSDDKGDYGPARYFGFRLPITGNGQFATAAPVLTTAGTVLGPGNVPLLPGQMDLESIRKFGGDYIVSSEGTRPFIRVVSPPGLFVRDLPIPAAYRPGPGRGLGSNSGFEGLTVTPTGQVALMTESALLQDGGAPTKAAGTRSRLLITGAKATSEFVYSTDPVARGAGNRASKGVSEILSISKTDYLVLERGFDPVANRNDIKIYVATTRGATPVTGVNKLTGREVPMSKRLVFDFGRLPRLRPDNVEGMAWGPTLSGNRRSLILISDDNFNNPAQRTKIHSLALTF